MATEEMITSEVIKEKTLKFLVRYIRKENLDHDEDFFAKGLANSLFAMQLVMFVEKEFSFKVENEDLDLKNFRTVNAITDFVNSKLHSK